MMKKIAFISFFLGSLLLTNKLVAQNNFYNVNSIREIKIYFDESNWEAILNTMYSSGLENRLLARSIKIDGIEYDSVGVRYKGFSSVNINRKKNPFNLKLDYVKKKQAHHGISKIKLSNVFQDPSFVREVLSYDIARKYMPASEANYANVFVNDILIGLYSNIEAIDNEFLQKHFNSSGNTFFKGNPASLDLTGENSNLSNSLGTDSTSYYHLYDLKSDYGWSDLYDLIDTLNNFPETIEKVLNVDRTLWMHAFNYSLINFDSYVGYAQNYYLYKDNNGRFNPILWDLNQSFASYRLADASVHFSGFNIREAKEMDPLLHHNNISVYPRPLMRNIFNNDRYRKMYIAHMRTIIEENFTSQNYVTRGKAMQDLIDDDVKNDVNKFYSYTNFKNNLTSMVTELVDYPGITDLMDSRNIYLSTYPGFKGAPGIKNIETTPSNISIGDNVWVTAKVIDEDSVILAYRFNKNKLFTKVNMFDDGLHNDGMANDSIYGFEIMNIGSQVQFYIYAENDSAGRFSPERAAYEYYTITTYGDVVINELSASNKTTQADQNGEYDDWIELYNNTSLPIVLDGYHLSDDNTNLAKWSIPNGTTISANNYLIIWADKDTLQTGLHTNFRLSGAGETLYFSDKSTNLLDETVFNTQTKDVTWGRYPNGIGDFVAMTPTYSAINSNSPVGIDKMITEEHKFIVYPNPANDEVSIQMEKDLEFQVIIRNINGKILTTKILKKSPKEVTVDITDFASGLYFITITNKETTSTKKLIIK